MKHNYKNHNKIAIISRESNEETLDVRLLREELQARGLEVRTLCRLLTKERSIKKLGYIGHIFKQIAAISRADVVILDTYCIPVSMLPHSRRTSVVQMWHAMSAVKQFGWQTVGKPDGSSKMVADIMRMHRGYDYVISPSDVTAEAFSKAFRVPKDKIRKFALPRADEVQRVSHGEGAAETAAKIRARYPGLRGAGNVSAEGAAAGGSAGKGGAERKGRKIILYAPTFHKGAPADVRGLFTAIEAAHPDEYALIVKLHPIDRETGDIVYADNVIYDNDFSSYEWLSDADAVISDYSSFIVESTLADKPLYLYVYDIDKYAETTGLNVDPEKEPIAPYVFREAAKLAEALGRSYDMEALRSFRDRYIDVPTDNSTARLADFITGLLKERKE